MPGDNEGPAIGHINAAKEEIKSIRMADRQASIRAWVWLAFHLNNPPTLTEWLQMVEADRQIIVSELVHLLQANPLGEFPLPGAPSLQRPSQ